MRTFCQMPHWLLGAFTLLLGAGGCFFTEIVNEAPVAGIRNYSDGLHYIGDILRFDATKTVDDVTSNLTCEWRARINCDTECESIAEGTGNIDYEFTVPITSHDQIVIELKVTDELGATRLQPDLLTVDVTNRPPEVTLQVTGKKEQPDDTFILYRPIDLVIVPGVNNGASTVLDPDGDDVAFTWRLLAPPGSQASARSFEPVGEEGYQLIPDVSGMWGVVLTADDGFGGEVEVRRDFTVGVDAPPCLQSVDPSADTTGFYLVESSDGPRSFSVLSVKDVLDPFPASLVVSQGARSVLVCGNCRAYR